MKIGTREAAVKFQTFAAHSRCIIDPAAIHVEISKFKVYISILIITADTVEVLYCLIILACQYQTSAYTTLRIVSILRAINRCSKITQCLFILLKLKIYKSSVDSAIRRIGE